MVVEVEEEGEGEEEEGVFKANTVDWLQEEGGGRAGGQRGQKCVCVGVCVCGCV